ncbi:MAG: endonuclease [Betaproteobacteria bacterium HGW-Betaproteobacteria-16]|nr:MAG: endonuclease [Betaproteobacteria bacterium HGW-Betaproteobacteria-16]
MTGIELRIVSWNCAGGLRKKWQVLDELNADLLIIQECENPALAADPAYLAWAGDYLWTGPTKNKGIGVFARNGLQVEQQQLELGALEFFLPCVINGDWPLLATWTAGASSGTFSYIGQLWRFLQLHKNFVGHPRGMVVGDLNSNVQWDKQHRTCSHSDVVQILSDIGLQSAYHRHFKEPQGKETRATFFHHRKVDKPYHIDYAFLGAEWLEREVQIGTLDKWLSLSDHVPISVVVRRVGSNVTQGEA